MYNKHYVKGLRRTKDSFMVFTILLATGIIFLVTVNFLKGKEIGRLQAEITALENMIQESMIFVPDGRSGYKEFEIVKRF